MKKICYLVFALCLAFQTGINSVSATESIAHRLAGSILLQVESNGEGWYVNPAENQRYYLGRPADAFSVMRRLGLGISNASFTSFLQIGAPKNLSGKILLKVQDKGQAYYVYPKNLQLYALGRPDEAFGVMRELGMGISNSNLHAILISENSAIPTVGQTPTPRPLPTPTPTPVPNPIPQIQASVSPYVSAVLRIQCYDTANTLVSAGSGTLVEGTFGGTYEKAIMTNLHVVGGTDHCTAFSPELNRQFTLSTTGFRYSAGTDFVIMEIFNPDPSLNFSASQLSACPNDIAFATTVYIIGYPITTGLSKTITSGILSGHFKYNSSFYYDDYYVSAKIDAGNSGGLALAEYNHGFCLLGIPTAVAQGNYENLAIIQNINNLQSTQ